MTLRRRSLLPALAGGAMLPAAFARLARAESFDSILRDRKMKIGYINSPPGARKDPNTGEVTGLYVDAITMILDQVKVEPVWVETVWANFVAGLQANQFDLCIAGTFATVSRASAVDFVKPICYMGMSISVKASDNRFTKITDFNRDDITIAAVLGDASNEFVRANFPKAKMVTLATGNLSAPFVEVSAGRADAGIEDVWNSRHYAQEHPEVKDLFGDKPFNVMPIAWTIKRGNTELMNFINVGMDWLMINDRLNGIAAKYGDTGRYIMKPNFVPLGAG